MGAIGKPIVPLGDNLSEQHAAKTCAKKSSTEQKHVQKKSRTAVVAENQRRHRPNYLRLLESKKSTKKYSKTALKTLIY